MRYAMRELPGAAPLWGDSVFHCPFCHGWEVRDEPLAVLGDGSTSSSAPPSTDHGFLTVDASLATTVPGVYAAGDVTGQPQAVANAIASGFMAAAMIVRERIGSRRCRARSRSWSFPGSNTSTRS